MVKQNVLTEFNRIMFFLSYNCQVEILTILYTKSYEMNEIIMSFVWACLLYIKRCSVINFVNILLKSSLSFKPPVLCI